MKITGYQIQQSIKARQKSRDLLTGQFNGSLSKFKGEVKRNPVEIASDLEKLEREIAQLQTAQGVYNTRVVVTFEGQDITLLQAVKQVGGLNRISNMWTAVAQRTAGDPLDRPRRRYTPYDNHGVRDPEQEYAQETVDADTAIRLAQESSKKARTLRACISAGNAREIELDLNPELID